MAFKVPEHKADSLIAKFKEAGGTVRELMYEQSHRDYLRLVICIIVCLSWAVNHYRDNAITLTKNSARQKCQRTEAMNAATHMQMRQRDVAALDAKYTKELADAKAENDFSSGAMMLLVVVGCTSPVCQPA